MTKKKPKTKTITDASGAQVIVRSSEESLEDTSERMNAQHRDEGNMPVDVLGQFVGPIEADATYAQPVSAPVLADPAGDMTPGREDVPNEEDE